MPGNESKNGGGMSNKTGRGFFEAIGICFSKYATFKGRAPRSEFWWWTLFQFCIAAVFESILLPPLLQDIEQLRATGVIPPQDAYHGIMQLIFSFVSLALLLPTLSVGVRRLHDRGKSAWWYFFPLVPVIGSIMMLIWFCQRGTPGNNRFGPDPLQEF
jgi:uncharacterized membrane protein YhaH (DUF805 family)